MDSLARREGQTPVWQTVLLVVALILAILVAGLLEGPDLEEHARWMADVRDQGAAVLW